MTPAQKKTTASMVGIPAAILVVTWLVRWSLETFNAQAQATMQAQADRYVTRVQYESDQADRAAFDSLQAATLRRIDARVADIYCGRLPTAIRAGCR